jgi:ELWxxDGT repeat protein
LLNKLLFSANDGRHGEEVWLSDGNAAGTFMRQDITITGGFTPDSFIQVGLQTFGVFTTEEYGTELWVANTVGEKYCFIIP